MSLPKVKYTQPRKGRYHLQLPIPKEFQEVLLGKSLRGLTLSGKTARGSLKTADPRVAELEVAKARAELDTLIECERAKQNIGDLVAALPPDQRRLFDETGSVEGMQEELQNLQKAREGKKMIAILMGKLQKGSALASGSKIERRRHVAEASAIDEALKVEAIGLGKTLRALGQEVDLQEEVLGLRELAEKYQTAKHDGKQTHEARCYTVRRFIELHGDMALDDIRLIHLTQYADEAIKLPKSTRKDVRNLDFQEAVALADKEDLQRIRVRTH